MVNIIDPSMWLHNCKEVGVTATLKGEPCNWCDITQEDVEEEALLERHDLLVDPNE